MLHQVSPTDRWLALWRWRNVMAFEDVGYRLFAERVAQLAQFAFKFAIALIRVLFHETHQQRLDLGARSWPPARVRLAVRPLATH
jgi:hypothetical protein